MFFLIFVLKHEFWIHVGTASAALTCTHNLCLSENKENIEHFQQKIVILSHFYLYNIAKACFLNEQYVKYAIYLVVLNRRMLFKPAKFINS